MTYDDSLESILSEFRDTEETPEPESEITPPTPEPEVPPAKAEEPVRQDTEASTPQEEPEAESIKPEKKKKSEKKQKKEKTGKKHRWILPVCIIAAFLGLAAGGVIYAANYITDADMNMPNVYIGGIYVGSMTAEETLQALKDGKWDETVSGALTVSIPKDVTAEIDYIRAGYRITSDEAAKLATAYGHDGTPLENLKTYLTGLALPTDISLGEITVDSGYIREELQKAAEEFDSKTENKGYVLDEEAKTLSLVKGAGEIHVDVDALLSQVISAMDSGSEAISYVLPVPELQCPDFQAIYDALYAEPVDAYYDRDTDTIVPHVTGADFDVEEAVKAWTEADVLETVTVKVKLVQPEITTEYLESVLFRDVLGEYSTCYSGSTANRESNIHLAVSQLDNIVLLPGETFSYNETLGERTEEAGYLKATVYNNGDVVEGIGGGICQVSSTLCVAVRLAQLEYDRANHQFKVAYMDAGLDATVDWPNRDFTFTNTRDYPVRIHAWCDDDEETVNMQILGTDVDGTYVEIVNKIVGGFTWGQYNPGDKNHSDEYLNTIIGYAYTSTASVYDSEGRWLEDVYNPGTDYCMYLMHDVQMPADYGPDDDTDDEPVDETPAAPEGDSNTDTEPDEG